MFETLRDWIAETLGPGHGYQMVLGEWVDDEVPATSRACVIQGTGGPASVATDRRPTYRVLLLGARQTDTTSGPPAVTQLRQDIEALMAASIAGDIPCGVATIRAMGEPVGPGRTTENRVWFAVSFEIVY